MNYKANIPFEDVPRELIDQLNSCRFTYDDYLRFCPFFNLLPTYWNIAILQDEQIVAFYWGTWEPLERFAHLIRGSILPSVRRSSQGASCQVGAVFQEAIKAMDVAHVFFITDRPDVFIQSPEQIKFSNSSLMEVILDESVHQHCH